MKTVTEMNGINFQESYVRFQRESHGTETDDQHGRFMYALSIYFGGTEKNFPFLVNSNTLPQLNITKGNWAAKLHDH